MKFDINDYKDTYMIYDDGDLLINKGIYVDRQFNAITGIVTDDNGYFYEFIKDGQWHREDGPARIIFDHNRCNVVEYDWCLRDHVYSFDRFVIKAGWTDEAIIEWKLTNDTV